MIQLAVLLGAVSIGTGSWVSLPIKGERQASELTFEVGGVACRIAASGGGHCGGWKCALPVPKGDFIRRAYAIRHRDQLVVAYEFTNDETGGAAVVGLEHHAANPAWRTGINEFNLGRPAIRGHHAYMTAAGFIGKLDLVSGRFAWVQEGLTEKHHRFEWLATPTFRNGSVVVREAKPEAYEHHGRWAVELDEKSGDILVVGDVRAGR